MQKVKCLRDYDTACTQKLGLVVAIYDGMLAACPKKRAKIFNIFLYFINKEVHSIISFYKKSLNSDRSFQLPSIRSFLVYQVYWKCCQPEKQNILRCFLIAQLY